MMKPFILFASLLVALVGCNNLEDAGLTKRNTSINLIEGPYNMTAAAIEKIPGGFMILGNAEVDLEDTTYSQTVLIEVDENGNQIGDPHTFDGGTGKAFKYFTNGSYSGYVIIGDSIYVDPAASQGANVNISSMRILLINATTFNEDKKIYKSDENEISDSYPVKKDFFGGSVNFTSSGIVFLGSYKDGVSNQQAAPEKQLLFSVDNALDSVWYKEYDLLGNTYANSKSIHVNDGHILWASSVLDVSGEFTSSYVTIPYITEGSQFENNDPIGLTTTQSFVAKDIQPAYSESVGYGVVGTYSQATDGSKGNMFFFRVFPDGKIVPGSDRYFDGIESFKPDSAIINKDFSSIVDEGEALCSTNDGGFLLAGSFTTNPQKGKGGKDILLVKVNRFGSIVWLKTFGSEGDETVSAVTENSNGDLLVLGTNNLDDYSSIFLMKVDKNGDLKN